ncbi:class I SAM-dependent methyltransferase [Streptomyces chartreusis]|uniref:class I SAM-dependent methyltransferase n=1 Tax=Streptomyces chartreusis TaxID=1969 RepID=UPI0036968EA2
MPPPLRSRRCTLRPLQRADLRAVPTRRDYRRQRPASGTKCVKWASVDLDPVITVQDQKLTPSSLPVTFTVADAVAEFPAGSYDVITCVATVHHLPFAQALACFSSHLAPGGTLVIVDLPQARAPVDHVLGALAIPANAAMGWLKNKGRPSPRPASMTAPTRAADMTFDDIVRETGTLLPGAGLRRRLFWRYTLVWHQP